MPARQPSLQPDRSLHKRLCHVDTRLRPKLAAPQRGCVKLKVVVEDLQAILVAASFAAEKHSNQKRKGAAGEPYINHLIEVAGLVATALTERDANIVIAALLHDTVEDTNTTREELIERFGTDVADLVAELTDDKSLPQAARKRLQIEHAPRLSVRAQTIKLADKISNVRSILTSPPVNWSLERRQEYVVWSQQVVSALSAPNPILKREFERIPSPGTTSE
jgi:(p)ppGpp synthase/HD superfamily hydrolase